jgi:hypothetical protein
MQRILSLVATSLMFGSLACGPAEESPGSVDTAAPGSFADQLVGTYRLEVIEGRDDNGEWVFEPPERTGYIMYDSTGFMAVQIMPVGRKPYAGEQPTPDEAVAAIYTDGLTARSTYSAYHGPYSVDAATSTVTHHRDRHLNPNNTGVDAVRHATLSGNDVILSTPADAPNGEFERHLIWRRQPDIPDMPEVERQFVGFWRLVSREHRTLDGELVSTEEGRTGYIVYTSTGHMAVQMMQPDRKQFASSTPTPQEALGALTSFTNYFGTFSVDEAAGTVTHEREGNLNPGQINDVIRYWSFSDNRLILKGPPTTLDDGRQVQFINTWERVVGPSQ